ncbi:hypothetical protein Bhyg_12284, partial [Pseudolycoriella hygida]
RVLQSEYHDYTTKEQHSLIVRVYFENEMKCNRLGNVGTLNCTKNILLTLRLPFVCKAESASSSVVSTETDCSRIFGSFLNIHLVRNRHSHQNSQPIPYELESDVFLSLLRNVLWRSKLDNELDIVKTGMSADTLYIKPNDLL